tara:strand:- start:33 stop:1424 length:1392 start_codon:yes stop_codon:yes gene_type:complete
MPTILGSNSASDAYDVANSLRFNDDDSARLSREFAQDPTGNRKTFTISCWVKRSSLSSNHAVVSASTTNNFNDKIIGFRGDTDGIEVNNVASGSDAIQIITNRKFRDTSAWYHIVVAIDTTQSSLANGVKFYVNGVRDTDFDGTPVYNQNATFEIGRNGSTTAIGMMQVNTTQFFDGYLAEFFFIDGQQLDPTSFGKFNDNGVWIPKDYTGTYGNNGFRLEFKQTGTSANSSGMGADTSGNDQHFTPTNLAATDVTTDTCTNNFNTLNFNANAMGGTLSEGNLKCVGVNAVDKHVFGTFSLTKGKWYFEIKATDRNARGSVWVSDTDHEAVIGTNYAGVSMHSGATPTSGTSNSNLDQAPTDGDIVCYAVDLDNGQVWFSRNANIDTSGTANVTGLATSGLDRDYRISQRETGNPASTFEHNYGNAPYAISSGNSDADGFGNFEYAVPSGYFALCTKNLAEYG